MVTVQSNASDPDEQFVSGTINLNTVSGDLYSMVINGHLLQHVLPIPDATVRDNVIKAIVKYRDKIGSSNVYNAADRGGAAGPIQIADYRERPGIAHLGELMEIVDRNDSTNMETIDTLAKDLW